MMYDPYDQDEHQRLEVEYLINLPLNLEGTQTECAIAYSGTARHSVVWDRRRHVTIARTFHCKANPVTTQ